MCVLTYMPLNEGFILTSNRDEAVARTSALPPRKYRLNSQSVFYPQDPLGGGTWIATNQRFTLCLLNGAATKHEPKPPYRHSRGKVILHFFDFDSVEGFTENYRFDNLEPFTLVVIDQQNEQSIYQIRWNGEEINQRFLSRGIPHIWSSATLYSPAIVAFRELCFEEFLGNNIVDTETLWGFHREGGGTDPENRLFMNRNNALKTLSMTQIVHTNTDYTIAYEDILQEKTYRYRIFQEERDTQRIAIKSTLV